MKIRCYTTVCLVAVFCLLGKGCSREDDVKATGDKKPREIVLDGEEVGPLLYVQKLARMGLLARAVEECNRVLKNNPENRYVRLERAEIFERLGQLSKAEEDLDYLIKNHPEFGAAYLTRARLFLNVQISIEGEHPLFDWLNSADKWKQEAALEAILEGIKEIRKAKNKQ